MPVPSPSELAGARWEDILPLYSDLARRPLDLAGVPGWLADWAALDDSVSEAYALAEIAYTGNTADPDLEAAMLRWSGEIGPRVHEQDVALARRLVETGYSEPALEEALRRFRTDIALFREQNVALQGELEVLSARYQKLAGNFSAEWEGRRITIPETLPFLEDPDRTVRERAFRARFRPFVEHRDELADVFDQMLEKRGRLARNAGFDSYRDYTHQAKHRFAYTPDDCLRFHRSVLETFSPLLARRRERRRELMGLNVLRPWDLSGDPLGRPGLQPFRSVDELVEKGGRLFSELDPALGGYYRTMVDEGLIDLPSRPAKSPGAYSTGLPHRRRPFVYMNAVGVADDLITFLHEFGHAFHGFEQLKLPYPWSRHPGAEMAEVASMGMELLGHPGFGRFYTEADRRRALEDHLDRVVASICHIATVDAWQHWAYTAPEAADRDARDAHWLRLRQEFDPGADWTGLEAERVARFYIQIHFFSYPLYYIEYGLAQMAALQVWRNSLRDHGAALRAYLDALALGATRPLPDLYRAAGAELVFDRDAMAGLVELLEAEFSRLA